VYLSGTTTEFFKDLKQDDRIHGVLFNTWRKTAREQEALKAGCLFGVDNGIFSNRFIERQWLTRLWDFWKYRHNCLVCPLPDFLYYLPDGTVRGDWRKTLDRFHQYKSVTKRMGFPVTLVTQDGLTPDNTPWSEIDAIFIGGSNYHKRGLEAEHLGLEAKRRGVYVHIGRVSSVTAAARFWPWADSYDGTTYTYEPDRRYEEYLPQWREFFNATDRPYQFKLV